MAGRPEFQPTKQDRKLVATMTAGGIEQEHICLCLSVPVSVPTLRKHFRTEIASGKPQVDGRVIAAHLLLCEGQKAVVRKGKLFQHAIPPNINAIIQWERCRMGWREPPAELHHGGIDGKPLNLVVTFRKPAVPGAT
jgi:hypothetical protein